MTMDSGNQLDYALFQLTPTRTRFDLVICAGAYQEKLASGLLEPFIAHCKFAKDQILKGGYSITLSASATWFTKSTIERFVTFVSTPEVLERCITIEREIENIDSSLNANTSSDSQTVYGLDEYSTKSAAFAYSHEGNTSDAVHEEDYKVHLQRVLDTRKAVLQREQAMVYARALVAGFETDNLQDLICFADAFGSPRLREACLHFMELCNTKSNDRVWMDEVAAMQAYSRSQYSYIEDDDPGQELRINVQNGNFATVKQHGSVIGIATESVIGHGSHLPQYMPNYQGGPMFQPPRQAYPFPGMIVPPYCQGNLPWPPNMEDSRSRKKRSQDGNFDSSDSSSGSDSASYKKSSSRKVVIRNINYVTSARDGKSENESNDNSSNGDRTIEDKGEDQKVTQQWNIFQNLLMKDEDEKESVEVRKPNNHYSGTFEEEIVSNKFEDLKTIPSGNQPVCTTKSSTIGMHEGDWFVGSLPDKVIQEKSRDIFEDHIKSKDVLVNDPLAVQTRFLNESSDCQIRAHDLTVVSESNLTQKRVEAISVNEPNDLYMVLERDTGDQQPVAAWTPEMESRNSNTKIVKLDSPEVNESKTKSLVGKGIEEKNSTIEAKSKALVGSRSKKSTATKTPISNGKSKKEEEKRKKMEELLTQRQKRIAERSAYTAKTTKSDKPKAQVSSQNAKKSNKHVISTSTIERLSAARVLNPKVLPTESKPGNKPTKVITKKNDEPKPVSKPTKVATKNNGEPKPASKPTKVATKNNGVLHTPYSQSTAGAEKKKVKPDNLKPLHKKIVSKNSNGQKKIADLNTAKQLQKASPIKKTGSIGLLAPAQPDNTKGVIEISHRPSSVHEEDIALFDKNGGSANKAINSVTFRINSDHGAKPNTVVKVNHEVVPVKEILTTLPSGKESLEKSNSKKKWIKFETSGKALSGFKKLLSFSRKT